MAINKIQLTILIILVGIVSFSFRCSKSIDCTENIYSFDLGIKAYPDKDSISIGDTIWLEVNELNTLKNLQTGSDVNYSGAQNLGSAIGFQAFSSGIKQYTIEAAQKFNYIVIAGNEVNSVNSNLYKEYVFAESNNRYIFKLGVVPKEKGIYRIVFSNAANVYRKSEKCTKAAFGLNFKNTDQHFYLFSGGADTPAGGGTYYFKVY